MQNELAEGVYLFRIEEAKVRTFGAHSRQILQMRSTIVDPQESDDERHKFFGRRVSHGYSIGSPCGCSLIDDLLIACGKTTYAPMKRQDASNFPTEDLIGLEFAGRASYTGEPNRTRYLRVHPVQECTDGKFRVPSAARSMNYQIQVQNAPVLAVPESWIPTGQQGGRFRSDQPNVSNMPRSEPGEGTTWHTVREQLAEKARDEAASSVYCVCASPQPKHMKFTTFEYDMCEACGKEIQGG